MWQCCRHCTFDSPGLSSESAGYPGLNRVMWDATP
ncbi:DNA-directed RNA polymerase [Prevotella salivae]|nr:DNA-directed RNA polymerase [Segatella salivae]